ncbi:hypothetical protein FHQ08_12315 [Lactobacillus sp. CC-MHH1034]|uniref:hypothetical protein n=1 Tax=Agrilactobacillus fermenti TaxID=2586909 RepID=UPI001E2D65D1|nr:hypothetical protein [Agrilactobacillus fermenti]MCD2257469.1 hypothetical protein [Agrilactobacillus fermenti]
MVKGPNELRNVLKKFLAYSDIFVKERTIVANGLAGFNDPSQNDATVLVKLKAQLSSLAMAQTLSSRGVALLACLEKEFPRMPYKSIGLSWLF